MKERFPGQDPKQALTLKDLNAQKPELDDYSAFEGMFGFRISVPGLGVMETADANKAARVLPRLRRPRSTSKGSKVRPLPE